MLQRWPILDLFVPPGVAHMGGLEVWDAVIPMLRPQLFPIARWRFHGLEAIPEFGPALLLCRVRNPLDVLALLLASARRGRKLRFAGAHLDAPMIGRLARLAGIFAGEDVERCLALGEAVVVSDGGPLARALSDASAAIVRVGLSGTEKLRPGALVDVRAERVLT
jgi:putative phosphoserine phosphatase/1-acylglycerol-3-phosphate O-acyltransferase